MTDFVVARAGTPEAASADYVCDGVADEVEINAAIAAAAASGGGTVHIEGGTYSTSAPITILGDNVSLTGDAGATTIEAAAGWRATAHPNGAYLSGMITFCAVDNFRCEGITLDAATNNVQCNGVIAIGDGVDGAGEVCTNGTITNNQVFLHQAHTYSIWSLRGQQITISDNFIDGGSTAANNSASQEGIEIYGGVDVTIVGNTVRNIGNAAINIGGLAGVTPDCSVVGVLVEDNLVESSRLGINLGTTYGAIGGAQDLRNVTITNNQLLGITEFGIQLRNYTGDAADAPQVANLTIANNSINMAVVPDGAGPVSAALWFFNATPDGHTEFSNIVVSNNTATQTTTATVFQFVNLPLTNGSSVFFYRTDGFEFSGNHILSAQPRAASDGMFVLFSRDFSVVDNVIDGAGARALYAYGTTDYIVQGNQFLNWNASGAPSAGLLLENTSGMVVIDNELATATPALDYYVINIGPAGPTGGDLVSGNTYTSLTDVALIPPFIQNVRLTGSAVSATGNTLDNALYGNALANTLSGREGNDALAGGPGADTLDGGVGSDSASYETSTAGVFVQLGNPAASTGDAAGDIYISIEGVTGSGFNDVLVGDGGANPLRGLGGDDYIEGRAGGDAIDGGAGNDHIEGGPGADALDGGDGIDTARYYYASGGLTVDLAAPGLNTGDAAGDTFVSVEGIIGSPFGDNLYGDAGGNALAAFGGNDSLSGRAGNDVLLGDEGDDTLEGGAGADYLDGGNGVDTATYAAATAGVRVDQSNPATNTGDAQGDALASIEIVIGSAFADVILANGTVASVSGMGGDDALGGGAGADRLDGGAGVDSASYEHSSAAVVAQLANPAANTGDAAGDTYISIEGLIGSAFNDVLVGDAAANRLSGLAGDDYIEGRNGDDLIEGGLANDNLEGGPGADTLDGGDGADFARYYYAAAGVVVDLANPASNIGDAAGDSFVSIEGIIGSLFGDTLSGDGNANVILGFDGADHLNGRAGADVLLAGNGDDTLVGGAGADRLDGGAGFDIASYELAGAGVVVHLASPAANTGDAAGDTYISIESLVGSAFNDVLVGNGGTDRLRGLAGNDYIEGRGGNDMIEGGAGNDQFEGGAGADTLDGGDGHDVARYYYAVSGVVLDLGNPGSNTGDAAGDTFVSIEGAIGSLFNDLLSGDAVANNIAAFDGNDTVDGRGGNDGLLGGNGDDTLIGGTGADSLDGGAGFDTASYVTAASAVVVDLSSPSANIGDAAGDVYLSIEAVLGSSFSDAITAGAGNHVLDGGGGTDVLTGGSGADTFRFAKGQANGDTVNTFNSTGVHLDLLMFVGYGTAAQGATFVQIDPTHWTVTSADGSTSETIAVNTAIALTAADYTFV
ncbi:MAG TPA: hypothetical protein VED01_25355 [Burkholderiales bacterium]|nr:hypothetical protein [Burkholderiales bacterium]